jgi:hypothetical protein
MARHPNTRRIAHHRTPLWSVPKRSYEQRPDYAELFEPIPARPLRSRRPLGIIGAPVALGVRPGSARPRIPRNEAVLGSAPRRWKLCRFSMRVPLRRSE